MIWNKFRYLLILAAAGVLSILYNRYYMSIIFLAICLMPFITFGLLCYVYGRVSAKLVFDVHVANKGEAIPITILLNNPTIYPVSNLKLYIIYKNAYSIQSFKKEYTVSLDARTKTSVICNLFSDYTGNLEICLKEIRIYDYLKLFSLKRKVKGELKTAVLPYFYELPEDYITSLKEPIAESEYYSSVKSGDDPSEVFAVREYREGDRMQRIHWKLSSKQGELMIKEFSDPVNSSLLLFVDLSIPRGKNILHYTDAILECAFSLSYTLLSRGCMHYFSWYDKTHNICRRIRVAQENEFYDAMDGILQAVPYMETTDALLVYSAQYPKNQYTDLFYITGEISAPKLDMVPVIGAENRQIICVSNRDNENEELEVLTEIRKKSGELEIDLRQIDVLNVRRDMEQLGMS